MRRPSTVQRHGAPFSGDHHRHHLDAHRRRAYRTRPAALPSRRRYHPLTAALTSPASPPHATLSAARGHLQPAVRLRTLPAAADDRFAPTSADPVSPAATTTSGRRGARWHPMLESSAVLTLLVVASLSLIVGAIYLLIYFKSIKPMSARSRNYMQAAAAGASVGGGGGGGKATDDDGGRTRSTHPFFRRS